MKPVHLIPLVLSLCLWACGGDNKPTATDGGEDSVESSNSNAKAVDYSLGRAMNNRLGKGINLGRSSLLDMRNPQGRLRPRRLGLYPPGSSRHL